MHFIKLSILLFSLLFLTSCDDGDILISEFNFGAEDDIEFCFSETSDDTVFYNYNSDNTEIIYVRINDEYTGDEEEEDTFSISPEESISTTEAQVNFVKFTNDIDPTDIFCTAIANVVSIERESQGVEGTVTILTRINTTFIGDSDSDGLTNEEEGFSDDENVILPDNDQDGIPDYLDEDDDNDNIRTQDELTTENEVMDTDGDGIANHLDDDDDGDGVLTRFEVTEDNNTPTNPNNVDNGVFFYLDNNVFDQIFEADITISNSFNTNFETIVRVNNLTLSGEGDGTSTIVDTLTLGTNDDENINTAQTVVIAIDGTVTVTLTDENDQ